MGFKEDQAAEYKKAVSTTLLGLGVVIFLIITCMVGCPQYSVYSERKKGEAELARANYNRQIQIAESKAKMEGAAYLAAADSLRALGTAASNKIIAGSISQPYLNWLWVESMGKNDKSTIYVPSGPLGFPTMPIQEASRFNQTISK